MCLLAVAVGQSARYPLVLASNRDEYHERPALALEWWQPPGSAVRILAGRDLQSDGTWLGLTAGGRLAALTNLRSATPPRTDVASRGALVTQWLVGDWSAQRYGAHISAVPRNGYNLVMADLRVGQWWCWSSATARAAALPAGLYGLSNGDWDAPWPKVTGLKRRLRQALTHAPDGATLAQDLFGALADRRLAADQDLPSTGVPQAWERALSAAFIHSPGRAYGTRCSTVLVSERRGAHAVTRIWERSFDAQAGLVGERCHDLGPWPAAPGP